MAGVAQCPAHNKDSVSGSHALFLIMDQVEIRKLEGPSIMKTWEESPVPDRHWLSEPTRAAGGGTPTVNALK